MKIKNFHSYKTRNFVSKRVFYPYKTRSFEDTEIGKISVPFKSGKFEGNRKFLRWRKIKNLKEKDKKG